MIIRQKFLQGDIEPYPERTVNLQALQQHFSGSKDFLGADQFHANIVSVAGSFFLVVYVETRAAVDSLIENHVGIAGRSVKQGRLRPEEGYRRHSQGLGEMQRATIIGNEQLGCAEQPAELWEAEFAGHI